RWRSGSPAPSVPWDARTLEWWISSPPPVYNFEVIPVVQDRDDWWSRKRGLVPRRAPAGGSGDGHGIHLPQPSFWPLVTSLGIFIGAWGIIYSIPVLAIGGAIMMIGMYAWSFEPVNDPEPGESDEQA
ncbi:MAG: cytochrome ubiquinol oxidase subunit I, partial [Dehalococcoidia bacterium]|nr:cytochrome ubiquinol oxidase subunit I [Dehalococcoidia bacterium]